MIEDIDNSVIDRIDGNLPENEVDITKETPEYENKVLPGVEPKEIDPTKGTAESNNDSPSRG